MRTCSEIQGDVWAYLDGALEDETPVRAHARECEACARRVEAARAFLEAIAEAGRETAPESLRARVTTILRSAETGTAGPAEVEQGSAERGSVVRRIAAPLLAAAAVAALLLVTTPWGGETGTGVMTLAEGFAEDHGAHAEQWPSLYPVDFGAPDPPALSGSELTGSSRCVIEGEPYAHYTYVLNGEHVSVYLPFDGHAPAEARAAATVEGIRVVGVGDGPEGPRAVLVSEDIDEQDLIDLWNRG